MNPVADPASAMHGDAGRLVHYQYGGVFVHDRELAPALQVFTAVEMRTGGTRTRSPTRRR